MRNARVISVDVPGGRSQGVLPMTQFPDGPPELGSEVEVSIEGVGTLRNPLVDRA